MLFKTTSTYGITSTAHKLEGSEDSYFIDDDNGVYAVMDGVSGSGGGDRASQFVKQKLANLDLVNLEISIKQIDEDLADRNNDQGVTNFTTLTLIHIKNNKATLINIGDSRIYRFRKSRLKQLTIDDDFLSLHENLKHDPTIDLENLPEIERDKIRKKLSTATSQSDLNKTENWFWEARGNITRVVGKGTVKPKSQTTSVKPNDIYILTTDGVHDNLTAQDIENILNKNNFEDMGRELVQSASKISLKKPEAFRTKPDDITAVVVKVLKS
jgi:serine/threonine protein phosphatase PrpC